MTAYISAGLFGSDAATVCEYSALYIKSFGRIVDTHSGEIIIFHTLHRATELQTGVSPDSVSYTHITPPESFFIAFFPSLFCKDDYYY